MNVYLSWYLKLWEYVWKHFVDHEYGAWYRILTEQNMKYGEEKSPAGKTDYHNLGVCFLLVNLIRRGLFPY